MSDDNRRVVTVTSYRRSFGDCGKGTYTSLIRDAIDLFALGYTRAACNHARQAIERTLRDLQKAKSAAATNSPAELPPEILQIGSLKKRLTIPARLAALAAAGIIPEENKKQLDLSIDAGNRASHGQPVKATEAFAAIQMARYVRRRVEKQIVKIKIASGAPVQSPKPKPAEAPPVKILAINYAEPFQVFAA